jgi:hypothetical protein
VRAGAAGLTPVGGSVMGNLIVPLLVLLACWIGFAFILRTACSIYNTMVGGGSTAYSVPLPHLGWAMIVVLVNLVVATGVHFLVHFGIGLFAAKIVTDPHHQELLANFGPFVVNFFVTWFVVSAMLPTSLSRALLVTFFYYLVIVIVLGVIGFLYFSVLFSNR